MDQHNRRSFLAGLIGFAGVGTLAGGLSSVFAEKSETKSYVSLEREANVPSQYVFASDPRAKEPGYLVMPG